MIEHINRQQYFKLQKKTPKYHNQKTDYTNITFHSKKEAGIAHDLDMRLYAKDIPNYKHQYPIPLIVNGIHIAYYIADFVILDKNGKLIEIIEVKGDWKGAWTQLAKIKMKLVKALYPDILFTVL